MDGGCEAQWRVREGTMDGGLEGKMDGTTTPILLNSPTWKRTHSSWNSLMRDGMLVAVGGRGRSVFAPTRILPLGPMPKDT